MSTAAARKIDPDDAPFVPPELAPIDDEPVTPEEEALVAEARAEVARGELIPAAEVYRRLGL